MRAYSMRNNNQVLHGDQTRCEANFYTVNHTNADARSVCGSWPCCLSLCAANALLSYVCLCYRQLSHIRRMLSITELRPVIIFLWWLTGTDLKCHRNPSTFSWIILHRQKANQIHGLFGWRYRWIRWIIPAGPVFLFLKWVYSVTPGWTCVVQRVWIDR